MDISIHLAPGHRKEPAGPLPHLMPNWTAPNTQLFPLEVCCKCILGMGAFSNYIWLFPHTSEQ